MTQKYKFLKMRHYADFANWVTYSDKIISELLYLSFLQKNKAAKAPT